MTAEIAIVNRSALALAADSAVTIRIGAKSKIYDSAEKIFEFSRSQPIALMLYNNVEFVGVPLDVIARKYRSEISKKFLSIKDASEGFLEYLRQFPREIDDEKLHLFQVLLPKYKKLARKFTNLAQTALKQAVSGEKPDDPQAALVTLVEREIAEEDEANLAHFLQGKTLAQFKKRYEDVVEAAIDKAGLGPLKADLGTKLYEYAFSLVKSGNKSSVFTGLVIGGFCENDLFPTVAHCEIDGVYFDELKFVTGTILDIDRRGRRAAVLPFAQQEMAQRFIYGLDTNLEGDLQKFIAAAAKQILEVKPGTFTDDEKKAISEKLNNSFEETVGKLKDKAEQNILDIVHFMSKKELAEMAHALVELTSKKRRYSAEEDTVGGPIDVAITRNEGFIWIQRKHYFEPELNQNYLIRIGEREEPRGGKRNVRTRKASRSKKAATKEGA